MKKTGYSIRQEKRLDAFKVVNFELDARLPHLKSVIKLAIESNSDNYRMSLDDLKKTRFYLDIIEIETCKLIDRIKTAICAVYRLEEEEEKELNKKAEEQFEE